jgi:hypothetical protein
MWKGTQSTFNLVLRAAKRSTGNCSATCPCDRAIEKREGYEQRWKIGTDLPENPEIRRQGGGGEAESRRALVNFCNLRILSWRIFRIAMLKSHLAQRITHEAFTELG